MIRLDHVQGSPEWLTARLGIPTASQFHRVMTEKTEKYSAGSTGYAIELAFERITGQEVDGGSSAFMERGSTLEAKARAWYAMTRGVEVEEVGLCLTDDRKAGSSPDAFVGAAGGLEIKCLGALGHLAAVNGEFPAKMTQVQGGMWVCEREWWDVVAYNPDLTCAVWRVWRDEEYIRNLAACMARFHEECEEVYQRITGADIDGVCREIGSPPVEVEVMDGSMPMDLS